MQDPVNSQELAAQVRSQLADVGRRIEKLVALQDGLRRILALLADDDGPSGKMRSNGAYRFMIETKVLEALVAAKGQPLPTLELFENVLAENPMLKYTTFRSHLSRFKKRGLIAAATRMHGYWQLPV